MNKQDKQVVPYPKEREKGIRAVGDKLKEQSKTLTAREQNYLLLCVEALKIIRPSPRVSKMLGEFLIDMAEEQYKQDKIYGTDSDNENQMVISLKRSRKKKP